MYIDLISNFELRLQNSFRLSYICGALNDFTEFRDFVTIKARDNLVISSAVIKARMCHSQ